MNPTHRKEITHVSEIERTCRGSVQWLLECVNDPLIHHANHLQVFICGEDAFREIAHDIRKARKRIDLICWGFDPAMELERSEGRWPRGETYGDLLADAAECRNVAVRLLCWYDETGSSNPLIGVDNMPGYSKRADGTLLRRGPGLERSGVPTTNRDHPSTATPSRSREDYNAHWYAGILQGHDGIALRVRGGNRNAVHQSIGGQSLDDLGGLELQGMEQLATHHQKTILIDFGGADPVGYVMGLNSVTDYWDSQQHLFNDRRRGLSSEGDSKAGPGLKPYHDYVCRVQGEALTELHKNFESAWARAKLPAGGQQSGRSAALVEEPRSSESLARSVRGMTQQRAQIVRTQPEEGEATIERLYRQASSFARNYLYVENQYFQYTPWVTQLKKDRAGFVKGWQAAGQSMADLKNLHVMVVTPIPERSQMIPRTHDTVKSLGHGDSFPNQDEAIEGEIKRQRESQTAYDDYMRRVERNGGSNQGLGTQPPLPQPLSGIARTAQLAGDKAAISRELDAIGMRTLVASLFTYNNDWQHDEASRKNPALRYREIYIHSKLLLIDDSFFTLGSANLNLRSMRVDSEINVGSDDVGISTDLRRRVWGMHTGGLDGCDGGDASPAAMSETFKKWGELKDDNAQARVNGERLRGFLFPLRDARTSFFRLG